MAEESDAAFRVEYHDKVYDSRSEYILSYFSRDNTLSMYDPHKKRTFLKRTYPPEETKLEDLFLGTTVVVCGRALHIVDYADAKTRRRYATTGGSSVIMVKPDAYAGGLGVVFSKIYATKGIRVGRIRSVALSAEEAREFLGLSKGAAVPEVDVAHMSSGNMLAIEVAGDDIMAIVHALVGPAEPADARAAAPDSIRAALGRSRLHNAVYTSATVESAKAEIAYLFEGKLEPTALYNRCTVVLVKPHAVQMNLVGPILASIHEAGMVVSGVKSLVLTRSDAADFLEHYRTICGEFERWVIEMSSGPSIAIEVRPPECDAEDAASASGRAVDTVRALAGPYDPVIAKHLRPDTWRATWGEETVRNIVHVTDLPRDGPLESKFLFRVTAMRS